MDPAGLEDDGTFFPVVPFFPHQEFDPRPDVYVGGDIGADVVIARGDDAAVVLRSVSGRPDGFTFRLASYTRERMDQHRGPWGPDPNEALRIGFVYPDGTKVVSDHLWHGDPDAATHGVMQAGGSGDGWSWEMGYRAWPLPGPGTLTFVVRWRAMGIEDARYGLDASLLVEAARRAERLWD